MQSKTARPLDVSSILDDLFAGEFDFLSVIIIEITENSSIACCKMSQSRILVRRRAYLVSPLRVCHVEPLSRRRPVYRASLNLCPMRALAMASARGSHLATNHHHQVELNVPVVRDVVLQGNEDRTRTTATIDERTFDMNERTGFVGAQRICRRTTIHGAIRCFTGGDFERADTVNVGCQVVRIRVAQLCAIFEPLYLGLWFAVHAADQFATNAFLNESWSQHEGEHRLRIGFTKWSDIGLMSWTSAVAGLAVLDTVYFRKS